jgi:outer membrane protein assembly factor BamB
MRRLCLMSITFFLISQAAIHADWLGFRGPGHQGHAGPGDYPIRWGPEENVAWKVKLPGPGTSSPVIQGERVFITCFTGKKAKELTRYLICLDRKSGKILWEQKRPAPQPENDYTGHLLQHGFATGTPMIEVDRIYVNFSRGGVFAFDLDGKEIWHRELGKFLNSFGSGSSPSIFGDMLLVNQTTEAGALFALNKKTGETIWRSKIPGDCWATPLVVEVDEGKKEIVLNGQDGLYGFDPENGKQLWNCDTVGGYVSSTPVVYKDTLYLIGSNFGRKKAAAIKAGGRGDVSKTHVLWSNDKVGASYCSPLLIGDRLYFFSGQATCLNRSTGEIIAQNRLDGVTQLYSSPIEANGKIYLFTRNEGAYVLTADEKMSVLAHNKSGDTSAINASPAASGGDVLIRTQEYLYCLRKK